jgi:hypothetical protein
VGEETKFQPGNIPGLSASCGMKMDPPRGRRLSKGLASSSSSLSSSGVPCPPLPDSSLVASSFLASRCDFCSACSRSSGVKGCEFSRVRSEPVPGRVLLGRADWIELDRRRPPADSFRCVSRGSCVGLRERPTVTG